MFSAIGSGVLALNEGASTSRGLETTPPDSPPPRGMFKRFKKLKMHIKKGVKTPTFNPGNGNHLNNIGRRIRAWFKRMKDNFEARGWPTDLQGLRNLIRRRTRRRRRARRARRARRLPHHHVDITMLPVITGPPPRSRSAPAARAISRETTPRRTSAPVAHQSRSVAPQHSTTARTTARAPAQSAPKAGPSGYTPPKRAAQPATKVTRAPATQAGARSRSTTPAKPVQKPVAKPIAKTITKPKTKSSTQLSVSAGTKVQKTSASLPVTPARQAETTLRVRGVPVRSSEPAQPRTKTRANVPAKPCPSTEPTPGPSGVRRGAAVAVPGPSRVVPPAQPTAETSKAKKRSPRPKPGKI